MSAPAMPGHERLLRVVLATAIVGGPLGYLVGGLLAPAIHGSARSTIDANAAANPVTNAVHLTAFVVASFLLPVGAAGLAHLAYRRTPWLASIGGLLGVLGWLLFSALAALDDLANTMAHVPDRSSYVALLDRFTNGAVMSAYLLVYVICHLVAYVMFGIALRRARVIPLWSAWAMIASSPFTIAAFALPGEPGPIAVAVGVAALTLLLIGSLPAAQAMATWHSPSGP
ncbi:hypothetical protein V3C33_20175 [Micrococcaceae bacterium Sec5.7]